MAVVEEADGAAASGAAIDRRAELARQEVASLAGHALRSPKTTSRPPPAFDEALQRRADSPGGSIVSFRMTTVRFSSASPDTRATGMVSTWNAGVVPIASALVR